MADLRFKDGVEHKDFVKLNRMLMIILLYALDFFKKIDKPIIITSMIRKKNPNSLHYYGKAIDIRSRHLTNGQKSMFVRHINEKYKYGFGNDGKIHDTCIFHDVGMGEHFHLQVK